MVDKVQEGPRIALVGAGGAVGSQILELIYERRLPYSKLTLFGAPESDQLSVEAGGEDHKIAPLVEDSQLADFDIVFLAVPQDVARRTIEANPGAILIDLSGAQADTPSDAMVAPGFTARSTVVKLGSSRKYLTIPHPAATVLATILRSLDEPRGLVSAVLMLGASARGKKHTEEVIHQAATALNGELDLPENATQLAFNLVLGPEESRLSKIIPEQVAHLLGRAPELAVQVVAAPIFHGAALSVCLPLSGGADKWKERLRAAPGILLEEERPPALLEVFNYEAAVVSITQEAPGYMIWCAFDNLRLAASSALWCAETLSIGDKIAD